MSSHRSSKLSTLPSWVTRELIANTIEVWQPSYDQQLTELDAIEILLEVSALLDAIGDADDETIRGTGACL